MIVPGWDVFISSFLNFSCLYLISFYSIDYMKTILTSLIFFLVLPSFAQQISYTLSSKYDQKPIMDLKVQLFKIGKEKQYLGTRFTNQNGQVVFDSLAKGSYQFVIEDSIWACLPRYILLDKKGSAHETEELEYSAKKKMRDLGDFVISIQRFKEIVNASTQKEIPISDIMTPEEEQNYMRYLSTHIIYPQTAIELGISGKVYLQLVVDETNTIQHVAIAKSLDPEIDYEAIRVLHEMKRLEMSSKKEKGYYFYLMPISFMLR